jgi:hypothetical protein
VFGLLAGSPRRLLAARRSFRFMPRQLVQTVKRGRACGVPKIFVGNTSPKWFPLLRRNKRVGHDSLDTTYRSLSD